MSMQFEIYIPTSNYPSIVLKKINPAVNNSNKNCTIFSLHVRYLLLKHDFNVPV